MPIGSATLECRAHGGGLGLGRLLRLGRGDKLSYTGDIEDEDAEIMQWVSY
jgi:hypothetical protein